MNPQDHNLHQSLQAVYLKWHNGHRPLSGFIRELEHTVNEQIAQAKLDEAADIHYEGIKLLAGNHRATLNQLLDIIEHRHGKDMIAVSGKYNRVEGK